MEKNTSTGMKINLLRRFFKLYGADPMDLVFYLRDDNEGDDEEIAGTRYELRKRYWNYALDYIHNAHDENGPFSNANSSKENWINGYFGISGFNLCCVANYDGARVELYLGRQKEENKTTFDYLVSKKVEIEESLGVKLLWVRGDEIKSSKLCYELPGVSIVNETDWLQMAKFHAEWSRKFYDVIVPYLRKMWT